MKKEYEINNVILEPSDVLVIINHLQDVLDTHKGVCNLCTRVTLPKKLK